MRRINGKVEDRISADDRGLLYGDGMFETMRCVDGEIPLLSNHLARLQGSLARLGIPAIAEQQLKSEIAECTHERSNGIVKLIVTRGSGGRGYRPPSDPEPTVIVEDFPLPEWPSEWFRDGIRVRTCDARLPDNDPLAGLKTLNRLPQVLARQEWDDPEIAEGIMCDGKGRVLEGTMSNIFYRVAGEWFTLPLTAGVRGVMRDLLMHAAGIPERELDFDNRHDLEGMLVCNSVFGIWNVLRWDEIEFPSGTMPEQFREIARKNFRE